MCACLCTHGEAYYPISLPYSLETGLSLNLRLGLWLVSFGDPSVPVPLLRGWHCRVRLLPRVLVSGLRSSCWHSKHTAPRPQKLANRDYGSSSQALRQQVLCSLFSLQPPCIKLGDSDDSFLRGFHQNSITNPYEVQRAESRVLLFSCQTSQGIYLRMQLFQGGS